MFKIYFFLHRLYFFTVFSEFSLRDFKEKYNLDLLKIHKFLNLIDGSLNIAFY